MPSLVLTHHRRLGLQRNTPGERTKGPGLEPLDTPPPTVGPLARLSRALKDTLVLKAEPTYACWPSCERTPQHPASPAATRARGLLVREGPSHPEAAPAQDTGAPQPLHLSIRSHRANSGSEAHVALVQRGLG